MLTCQKAKINRRLDKKNKTFLHVPSSTENAWKFVE